MIRIRSQTRMPLEVHTPPPNLERYHSMRLTSNDASRDMLLTHTWPWDSPGYRSTPRSTPRALLGAVAITRCATLRVPTARRVWFGLTFGTLPRPANPPGKATGVVHSLLRSMNRATCVSGVVPDAVAVIRLFSDGIRPPELTTSGQAGAPWLNLAYLRTSRFVVNSRQKRLIHPLCSLGHLARSIARGIFLPRSESVTREEDASLDRVIAATAGTPRRYRYIDLYIDWCHLKKARSNMQHPRVLRLWRQTETPHQFV